MKLVRLIAVRFAKCGVCMAMQAGRLIANLIEELKARGMAEESLLAVHGFTTLRAGGGMVYGATA